MPRGRSLSLNDRLLALGMLEAGRSTRFVAEQFNVNQSTVVRLQQRYRETGNAADRARSGRPRATTTRQDRYLVVTSRRNCFLPATNLATDLRMATGVNVTPQTVRNRLRQARLVARRPVLGTPLPERNRQERLQWAVVHSRWIANQWRNVLFTDESRFNLSQADGRVRVWRRTGERHHRNCILERDRFGGGSVMVWGGIHHGGRTQLVIVEGIMTAQRYCDEIVQPVLIPFMQQHPQFLFQQDNARPHSARLTQTLLQQNNVDILRWPARSPDLSPIEHLWDELGRRIRRNNHQIINIAQLTAALQREWDAIPLGTIQTLIRSMRRRCVACIDSEGGHNRY